MSSKTKTEAPRRDEVAGLPRYLSVEEVLEITGFSDRTLRRAVQRGEFPKPAHLSANRVGWRVDVIRRWQESLEERDAS